MKCMFFKLIISCNFYTSICLTQSALERQVPRAASHIHSLRVAANNPILRHSIPVRDISPCDLVCECVRLVGVEDEIIEASEDDLGIFRTTEVEVLLIKISTCKGWEDKYGTYQLWDFGSLHRAGVGNSC